MGLLHKATLHPSKLDLLAAYLRQDSLSSLGSYRFDDPAGEVGIETHILGDGSGAVWHLPLTYRNEPLAGAEEWAIGTMEHSVLGTRWAYNGCADAVYAGELIRAILSGGSQVEQYFDTDEGRVYRDPTAIVVGSGEKGTTVAPVNGVHAESFETDTLIDAGLVQVVVRHRLDSPEPERTSATLTGTWGDAAESVVLAYVP